MLRAAASELARLARVEKTSPVYATAPVGGVPQPEFLNAAALVQYDGTPEELLDGLLAIEHKLGRIRREKWGPRTIDLDLLWGEGVVLESARLTLPHPHLHERAFAIAPLLDLVPDATDPRTGERYTLPPGDVLATSMVL
jgi:2-amino-4-hydroxy-6-hydroxymethyldihydropteridine diphosphokinase